MKRLNSLSTFDFLTCSATVVCLSLAFGNSAFGQDENAPSTAGAAPAAAPATHKVESGRLRIELKLNGTFESGQSAEISLRTNDWAKLEVKEARAHGAVVKKGEPLVTLDLEDLEKAITAAEQAVILGELGLNEARVTLEALRETTPIDLAAAERATKEAVADLEYFLKVTKGRSKKSAEYSLRNAQYSLEYAQEELNQLRQMYKADDITEETEEIILKRAERGVISAQFSLESRELSTKRILETELPRQELSLKDATKKQTTGVERTTISLTAAMKKAEIGLEKQIIAQKSLVEKLADLQADRKLLKSVTSPIDGYVFYGRVIKGAWAGKGTLEAALQPGGVITPKQVFMTVVAPGAVRIHTTVSEKDLYQVRPGQSGKVTATAFPDTPFEARVKSVSRVPSSPGSFDCVVTVDTGDASILSGMKGSVTIVTYDKAAAITVPKSAVFSDDDDSKYVYVASGDSHTKQTVQTGRSKGDKVEILEGLKAGSVILTKKP